MNTVGVMLQFTNDAWESAGGMLEEATGTYLGASDGISRTILRRSSQQIKCDAAFSTSAKIAIVRQTCSWHRNAESLVRREGERNYLSAWSFFPHLELFQQMLIKF